MTQLEFEFRVYRTRSPGEERECIVTRSVPHALQVWGESVDAFSRSLELVIGGDWLMQLLDATNDHQAIARGGITDPEERNRLAKLCRKALESDDEQQKQACIQEILAALGSEQD